ncbi:beta-phosphoglucomutase [Lysobacter sp. 5GHs7-4]|uniref:beta-phosphoglucomutase n=1 Tax=Lysobacter sp. 5GHs7-4 TaxID=2904253 RepID=UPI001E2A6014|nr:beta-phosphoglucomutase [Lysobacter sp. 5GHs7-4]UHQ21278.1 beta-phosphoglucomutase [Lysobacter sp. 5GHs7-4]
MTQSLPAAAAAPDAPTWCLRQDRYQPERRQRDASLFALANGSLGVRGGFEEGRGDGDGCYLATVYEHNPIHYHERFRGFALSTDTRVPVADGKRIEVWLGDQRLDPETAEVLAFERELDLRSGALRRRMRLRGAQGATVEILAERVVPTNVHPGACDLLAIRYRVTSIDYSGPIALVSAIESGRQAAAQGDDPRIGVSGSQGLLASGAHADASQARYAQRTRHGTGAVLCAQGHRLPDGGTALSFDAAKADETRAMQRYRAQLQPGDSVVLEKFVAYASSAEAPGLDARVDAALAAAVDAGYAAIAALQAGAVAEFWRDAELCIAGDAGSELALRFNLFHLWQSAGRDGVSGTAAKGLTGEGYEGHCFWDTEAFVLPVMAYTAPDVARAMLQARYRMLDAARAHAREMNHAAGALYPWRTIGGGECSAHYPSGSAAYHINAAIAYAIGLYLDASDDVDFLVDGGAQMLFETARIWPQVGHYNPRRGGAFCIHEVTGPDEYTAMVDNNYYTNRMAQQHLLRAVAVWERLHAQRPEQAAALAAALGLDADEVGNWRNAAQAMYLPYDEGLGVYAQDDGFLDKPRWPFPPRSGEHRPLLLDYHPLTLYRYQVCKQADVVMALVLAGADIDVARKRRSYDYYEAVTTHDSTLSACMFGILASEVGYADRALDYFDASLRVDLDDLHGNTDHGVHMAAMAGSWLALTQGFAGLRAIQGELHFAPRLPARWNGYGFGLRWRGRELHVGVDGTHATYRLIEGEPLEIVHAGQRLRLSADREQRLPLAGPHSDASPAFPRPAQALIFDLDGVLTDTAHTHYLAWKRLADEIGVPFDETVNLRLKGVDREASLAIILERADRAYDAAQRRELAARKNGYYRAAIESVGPQDLFPGVRELLDAARARGLKLGLASASKNAAALLARLGIADRFDCVADAARIARAKPAPDIFLDVAQRLGVPPALCIGIEDAAAGIVAIRAAGMAAVGIGDAAALPGAHAHLPAIAAFDLDAFVTR